MTSAYQRALFIGLAGDIFLDLSQDLCQEISENKRNDYLGRILQALQHCPAASSLRQEKQHLKAGESTLINPQALWIPPPKAWLGDGDRAQDE